MASSTDMRAWTLAKARLKCVQRRTDEDNGQIVEMKKCFGRTIEFLEQFDDYRVFQVILRVARLTWSEREELIGYLDSLLQARNEASTDEPRRPGR